MKWHHGWRKKKVRLPHEVDQEEAAGGGVNINPLSNERAYSQFSEAIYFDAVLIMSSVDASGHL